jgi:hypothetical protein
MAQSIKDKDGAHARLAPRFKTFQPASIDCCGAKRRAHVLDVSSRGARIYCIDALPVGSYLALQCCDFTLTARIVWAREQRFGVNSSVRCPTRISAASWMPTPTPDSRGRSRNGVWGGALEQ